MRKVHGKSGGDAGIVECREDRGVDHGLPSKGYDLRIRRHDLRGHLLAKKHLDPHPVLDGERDGAGAAIHSRNNSDRIPRPQPSQIVFRAKCKGDFRPVVSRKTGFGKQGVERFTRRDVARPSQQGRFDGLHRPVNNSGLQQGQGAEAGCIFHPRRSWQRQRNIQAPGSFRTLGHPATCLGKFWRHGFFRQNIEECDSRPRNGPRKRDTCRKSSEPHVAPSVSSSNARRIFGTANSLGS